MPREIDSGSTLNLKEPFQTSDSPDYLLGIAVCAKN